MRGVRAIRYIFFETLPAFLMGVFVFVTILLMFQALRLTEFVLVHGVSLRTIFDIMMYLSISFLPVILPMSLLFSVLLTYSRLSNDSEIVALKSLGLSMTQLTLPAIILAVAATLMSAQTSFYLGPWGNRQFELLINELGQQKVGATLKEGVFSEGFFDLVVYANKVDSKAGLLTDVFIYDERDSKAPVTIIAKHGQLVREKTRAGLSALLRLNAGNIHRTNQNTYTKVDFESYDISLFDAYQFSEKKKSPPSMTLDDLSEALKKGDLEDKDRRKLEVEYHRRWSLSAACLIFSLLGVGLGTVTNRRSSRGGGFVICLVALISYWILYVTAESLARSGTLPAYVGLWLVNALFLAAALRALRVQAAA
ncbi:MAG: LPS export ABC transporter permease LptF [Bdellovibrionales bacterium]